MNFYPDCIFIVGDYVFCVEEKVKYDASGHRNIYTHRLIVKTSNLSAEVGRIEVTYPERYHDNYLFMKFKKAGEIGVLLFPSSSEEKIDSKLFYVSVEGKLCQRTIPFKQWQKSVSVSSTRYATYFLGSLAANYICIYDMELGEETKRINVSGFRVNDRDHLFSSIQPKTENLYFVARQVSGSTSSISLCMCKAEETTFTIIDTQSVIGKFPVYCEISWMSETILAFVFLKKYFKYDVDNPLAVRKKSGGNGEYIHDADIFPIDERFLLLDHGFRSLSIIDTVLDKIVPVKDYEIPCKAYCPKRDAYIAGWKSAQTQENEYTIRFLESKDLMPHFLIAEEGRMQLSAAGKLCVHDGMNGTVWDVRERKITVKDGVMHDGKSAWAIVDAEKWKEAAEVLKEFTETRVKIEGERRYTYGSFGVFMLNHRRKRAKENFHLIQTGEIFKRKNRGKALPRDIMQKISEIVAKSI